MRSRTLLVPTAAMLLVLPMACDSKVKSLLDPDLPARIDTMNDCFPQLFEKFDALLELASTWRLMDGGAVGDPPGIVVTDPGVANDLDVSYTLPDGCVLTMMIDYYSPSGGAEDIDTTALTSLSEKIDFAATELGTNRYPNQSPFMVGQWSLNGPNGVTGMGNLTGIIGGATNQNELELTMTTEATPAGGPPPIADGMFAESATNCSLVFRTNGLQTDSTPTQDYPIGTLTATVTGPQISVQVTVTFDGSNQAQVSASGIPGTFTFNLDTFQLTQN